MLGGALGEVFGGVVGYGYSTVMSSVHLFQSCRRVIVYTTWSSPCLLFTTIQENSKPKSAANKL